MHTYINLFTCIHIHIHMQNVQCLPISHFIHGHTPIYMYIYIHTHTHIYTYIYICYKYNGYHHKFLICPSTREYRVAKTHRMP